MTADGNEVDDVQPIDLSLKSKPSALPKLTSVQSAPSNTQANPKVVSIDSSFYHFLKLASPGLAYYPPLNNDHAMRADGNEVDDDEHRFICDICQKVYKRKEALTEHRRLHTGEKPFECDKCFKRFSYRGSHYRHKQKHCPVLHYFTFFKFIQEFSSNATH
ncbi:zinc finger protein pat-9-like [Procambarus clarkii]|uniref:zinc finger protein pat-9-like n=1 Tax=Procambarus clarkii TaxID=6728 RepID=UPI003744A192